MWSIYFIGAQSKLMGKAVYQYYCSVFVIGICPKNHQDQISFNKKHVRIPFFLTNYTSMWSGIDPGSVFLFPLNHKLTSKTWILNQQNKILRGQNFRKLNDPGNLRFITLKKLFSPTKKNVCFFFFPPKKAGRNWLFFWGWICWCGESLVPNLRFVGRFYDLEEVSRFFPPVKTNACPLKINAWKMYSLLKRRPFLGDIR